MKKYETLFVLKTGTEEEVEQRITFVRDLISKNGGTIDSEDKWGEKKLCHEMNKEAKGIYVKMNYSIDGSKLDGIEKVCTLNQDVLRTMLVKREV
jgi:small subunit ribosomal protein S6